MDCRCSKGPGINLQKNPQNLFSLITVTRIFLCFICMKWHSALSWIKRGLLPFFLEGQKSINFDVALHVAVF